MLVQVRQRIKVLIGAGKTIDEAVAAAPTKDFDAEWGRGYVSPDVFVRMVFTSLIDSSNSNREPHHSPAQRMRVIEDWGHDRRWWFWRRHPRSLSFPI